MKELEMNPYVIQVDKFVNSLGKLSRVFLALEDKKDVFSEEQVIAMCNEICTRTCEHCPRRDVCVTKDLRKTHELAWEIFRTIEKCGVELNIEMKRKVKASCAEADEFILSAI